MLKQLSIRTQNRSFLAWTVHNEQPHQIIEPDTDRKAYQGVLDLADIVHHHCACSVSKIEKRYGPGKGHIEFIAEHGHYFGYKNSISRVEAREKLKLSSDDYVFLHFGEVRGYKGLDLVIKSFSRLARKNRKLLIAGRISDQVSKSAKLKLRLTKTFCSDIRMFPHKIENDDIQVYFAAADALVLGHTEGLNSGVAVLGMSFGKVVIGPDIGCIPTVLEKGPNFLYCTGDAKALSEAMGLACAKASSSGGSENRSIASTWEWENIARPILTLARDKALQT